jgi:hypothetical protein
MGNKGIDAKNINIYLEITQIAENFVNKLKLYSI